STAASPGTAAPRWWCRTSATAAPTAPVSRAMRAAPASARPRCGDRRAARLLSPRRSATRRGLTGEASRRAALAVAGVLQEPAEPHRQADHHPEAARGKLTALHATQHATVPTHRG